MDAGGSQGWGSALSRKVNLFDRHHKYADVMLIDEVVARLARNPAVKKAS